jgi:hypothetical protein
MNETTGGRGRWHRAWPGRAGVLALTAGVVLLAAACGGSSSSTGSGGSANAGGANAGGSVGGAGSQLLPFARCMRSHGVPNFPDPSSNGKFPTAQQLGVSSSQYQAAEGSCQSLLPSGTNDQYPAAEIPVLLDGMRKFSQCMRSHGVPNWPDPSVSSTGQPDFPVSNLPGLEQNYRLPSSVMAQAQACQHLMPSQVQALPLG